MLVNRRGPSISMLRRNSSCPVASLYGLTKDLPSVCPRHLPLKNQSHFPIGSVTSPQCIHDLQVGCCSMSHHRLHDCAIKLVSPSGAAASKCHEIALSQN